MTTKIWFLKVCVKFCEKFSQLGKKEMEFQNFLGKCVLFNSNASKYYIIIKYTRHGKNADWSFKSSFIYTKQKCNCIIFKSENILLSADC